MTRLESAFSWQLQRGEGYLLIGREKESRLMISDYDIVGTKFLGVFPLNLYRLDHGIGPCNISIRSIRRLHSSDSLGEQNGSQVGAWTADASIGIIADILYMDCVTGNNWQEEACDQLRPLRCWIDVPPILCPFLKHSMTVKWVLTRTAIFSSFSNSNRHSLPSSRSIVVDAPS